MKLLAIIFIMQTDLDATSSSHANYSLIFGVASLLLGLLSAWLMYKSNTSQNTIHAAQAALNNSMVIRNQLERTISEMRDWAQVHSQLEYVYQDIVLFGPRDAGKTSVAKLWTEPWAIIDGMPHTTNWTVFESSIFSINKESRRDPVFEVDRTYERILRIRLHDYPGDDEFRLQAVSSLPKLWSKAVLLLFFDVEANSQGCLPTHKNNHYYSRAFFESIERAKGIISSLTKVIIVFNKVDLLPADWTPEKVRRELCKVNADGDARVNSLFSGMLEYHFVSASTNQGLISLLGSAASAGLPDESRRQFEQHLTKILPKAKDPAVTAPHRMGQK